MPKDIQSDELDELAMRLIDKGYDAEMVLTARAAWDQMSRNCRDFDEPEDPRPRPHATWGPYDGDFGGGPGE